jgi:hypothetical protein
VKALWPHFDVQVFGSEATKVHFVQYMYMPHSSFFPDWDITFIPITSPTPFAPPHYTALHCTALQVFLPESDIDMVVLPPQELPVHQVRANLYKLADVRSSTSTIAA